MPGLDEATYERTRNRCLALLTPALSEEDRQAVQQFIDELDRRVLSARTSETILAGLIADLSARAKPTRLESVLLALQSPPFYFGVGLLLLALAFLANGLRFNSSLTFLIAMLGVAILLYGTGSQAAGTLGGSSAEVAKLLRDRQPKLAGAADLIPSATAPAGLNIAIAGGAAVLTAFFGWGVIEYYREIRQVFRDFDQYRIVRVELCDGRTRGCAVDPAAKPDPNNKLGDGVLPDYQMLQTVQQVAYLETTTGQRAFGHQAGNAIEFVVFDRDLGSDGKLKLMAKAPFGSGSFAVTDEPFAMKENACLVASPSGEGCQLIGIEQSNDIERVPIFSIRAVANQYSTLKPVTAG